MKKLLSLLLLVSSYAFGGTVTGQITTATSGPIINGTLTLTPTQAFVVTGTATVVSSAVACYTDASGNVVGEPNPLVAPVVTPNTGSGTLTAGTYFTRFAYQDATGATFYSFETTTILTSTGSLIVTAPVKQPATATGYKVFISTSSNTETLQGTVTGTPGTWANYTQSVPLVAGSALPVSNTTACKPYFSDEGIPGFSYLVGLSNSSGSNISGFPQRWRLFGGSAGTVNLSLGMPISDGVVIYPQPIVTTPAFNSLQSIAGPISLNGFGLTAGNVTASGNVSVSGKFSSSYVGTTDGTFTAGPINTTVSSGFINSMTQTNQFAHGFADEANVALTPAAGGYASFSAAPAFNLTTNTNHYNGYQFFPTLSGSGVLTSLIGSESAPVINTSSPVTELDDFYVQDASGTGGITLHRGLFIGPLAKASTNFGFVVQTPSIIGYTLATGNQLQILSEAAPASGNAPAQLHVAGATNPNEQLRLGFDTTSLVGTIQAEISGTSFNPLALQPNGGNTLVGTKTDCGKALCVNGAASAATYSTNANCSAVGTAASPSVASCGAAAAGQFSCATNATGATCQVNTTAVTANSEIFVFESDTAATGTRLGVTCNTGTTVNPATRLLASSVAGASFTINLGTVTTNPACFSYHIVN
jgi:hypothetical protein